MELPPGDWAPISTPWIQPWIHLFLHQVRLYPVSVGLPENAGTDPGAWSLHPQNHTGVPRPQSLISDWILGSHTVVRQSNTEALS